ncbi:MAG: acetyltransferase [Sphingomicrobium sp.]
MHKRVVLIGGGGHASDILAVYEAIARQTGEAHPVIGILDDGEAAPHRFVNRGVKQIGTVDDLRHIDATHYILGLGWPRTREAMHQRIKGCGLEVASVVHPFAVVPPGATIGEGHVVLQFVSVGVGATIGDHVYLSHGALLSHDDVIGDFVSVMPGASISGAVTVGRAATIGANATVVEGNSIGAGPPLGLAPL